MHRPSAFFHGEKCDATEEKCEHQCFAHVAELQEAEPVRFGA